MQARGHEHLCQVVSGHDSLIEALRQFLKGLGSREGIFIHHYSDREAWDLLREAGPADALRDEGLLSVMDRETAFQGGYPRIHHDQVAQNVASAVEAAKAHGRGLSILADAAHAYLSEGRASEWFAFENWLGRRLDNDVALVCLYRQEDLDEPSHLDRMMKTHLARLEVDGFTGS